MKQLLTFLCALLFALAGKAAPAGDELKQLLAEARAIVNTAGNAADREVSRALSEARRAVNATDRQIDRAMAEARRAIGASDREIDRAIAEARAAIDAAETAAVAAMGHDIPGPVAHRGADLVEALRAQQLQYILHERPAQQGDHGLGTVSGNGLQPAAHASGHDHSFHKPPPFLSII